MPVNSVAENVFGIAGTVCWTIQLIPQLWKSWREKDTTGLSEWMILAWSVSGAFLGTYSIVVVLNIPLIVQPQLFSALTMASWAQCQYYSRHRTLSVAWMLFLLGCVILGSFELGTVYALRSSYSRGEKSGIAGAEFFSIMSSVILALSFIPQYYEIYKRREVIGISLAFMAVDILGIFSDLSLVFKAGPFDAVAAVTYSLVVAMDGVVVIAAWILNPRARRRRQRQVELEASETGSVMRPNPPNGNPDSEVLQTSDTELAIVTTSTPSETIAPSSRTTIEKER